MNINKTYNEGGALSPQMKTFYDKHLIVNAKPRLVHDLFAQKKPIPKNNGKQVEFFKLSPFAPAMTPLQEGVTPEGEKLNWSTLTATVNQYGDFVAISDMLDLTALDNTLLEAGEILGDQAGRTLDGITREIICGGTNVMYSGGVLARHLLDESCTAKVADIKRAVTVLKNNLASPINGSYIAIVHPNVAHDLMSDPLWENVKSYDPKDLYDGEIGRLFGVRVVESPEAKVFKAAGPFKVSEVNGSELTVEGLGTHVAPGHSVNIGDNVYRVMTATGDKVTLEGNPTVTVGADVTVSGGKNGADVYATLIFGANAYGVTEIEGGGLQTIVKQLGSSGSADPLDQRATVGWKATRTAAILSDAFLVRLESTSTAPKMGEML